MTNTFTHSIGDNMQITFKTTTIVPDGVYPPLADGRPNPNKKTKRIEKLQTFDISFFNMPFEMVDDLDEMDVYCRVRGGKEGELQHNTIGLIADMKETDMKETYDYAGLSIRIHGRHRAILHTDDWLIVKDLYLNEDGTIESISIDTGAMSLYLKPVQK